MSEQNTTMENLESLAKRRGFIFQSSEIYGGMANSWDYGPLGIELKNNIKQLWWKTFVQERTDMVGLDAAIIMNPKVWEASGHIAGFSDPLVDCKKCKRRFREDHLEDASVCPDCGGELTDSKQFNLMFKTSVGPVDGEGSVAYLRPETAQGIFADFKNILETSRKKLPFGVAQIGKAFRNEITTGNFLFRVREFEQMEIEYFIREEEWEQHFEHWLEQMKKWVAMIGLKDEDVVYHDIEKEELAHYSKRTIDVEFKYPFGLKELYGLAYRTDYDLKKHIEHSGKDLTYRDPETNEKIVPHVIEPSLGVDRTFLAVMLSAYEEIEGGRGDDSKQEKEVVLRLPKILAPIKAAILPLSKKPELQKVSEEITAQLQKHWMVQYDETGSIGKRYRRQDEIGTPYCITVDFDTLEDKAVTVRDRDTMEQERVQIDELVEYLQKNLGC